MGPAKAKTNGNLSIQWLQCSSACESLVEVSQDSKADRRKNSIPW